jgi:hypothetical protein
MPVQLLHPHRWAMGNGHLGHLVDVGHMRLNWRGNRHKQGPAMSNSGKLVVCSGKISAMGIVKEFTPSQLILACFGPVKSQFSTFARKSQPRNRGRVKKRPSSDTMNAFPCVTTKPD